ncbi:MAG TPA: hypothetical protein VF668_01130 [Pyrinomonadaceae bacterium]|jgi:hypothetical protein
MISEKELKRQALTLLNQSGTAGLGNNYARMLAGLVDGKWNGDLKVKVDNPHKGKLHSWLITVLTSGQKRSGDRINHFFGLRLRGYLWTWDEGDDDNSEDYLSAEVAQIKKYFAERKQLGLDQPSTGFMKHDEIQETSRAIQHGGNGSAHVTNLFLGCHLYDVVTPQ